ncbi:ATP-binding protein [Solibacillus cecembensis]|uniref:sensor histidine kinase n=1 Tax=Solibacillus cecembensis TaxID=459347 RepID=UPI003D0735F4
MFNETHNLQTLLSRKYVQKFDCMMFVQIMPSIVTEEQAQLQLELLSLKTKHDPWLFQPMGYALLDQHYVIAYEDFTGQTLQQHLNSRSLPIHQALEIAIELTNACVNIHQHGDIIEHFYPSLIYIQPQTNKIKMLAPLAIRWNIANEQTFQVPLKMDELPYLAPEQTGRIALNIDERTDLYSIGAVLYEMVTGTPLFQANNTMDNLYYILTKSPDHSLLEQHCPLVMLRKIILKLLSKNKEERFQTAFGLRLDLLQAKQLLINGNLADDLNIGTNDSVLQPKLSTKLYGRHTEQNLLSTIFHKVQNGKKDLVFIQGPSGSGKSSIAKSLMQETILTKGYFIEGKFDQLQEQHTFQPIIEPLQQLLRQTYLEGEVAIAAFQKSLLEVDLMLTESLIHILPELHFFLNDKIRIVKESTQYTLQMNAYIFSSFQKILTIFARAKKPIVMFIDDIQWAQQEAIEILQNIFEQHNNGYFLLLIAMREENFDISETCFLWQKELDSFTSIQVHLLDQEAVLNWICDSLQSQCDTAHHIAQHLYQMTQGNALFIQEAFRMLLENKTIFYNIESLSWEYDVEQLHESIANNELFSFIENRMNKLTPKVQNILQIASCFGRVFNFNLLSKVVNIPFYDLLTNLEELTSQGFIIAVDGQLNFTQSTMLENHQELYSMQFQFIHDGVQQSAYEALSHEKRLKTHFSISQLLQKESDFMNHLHELVRQLNYCNELLSPSEQQQLAIWNFELGIQAKNAGLYSTARQYYKDSLRFLPENKWTVFREKTIQLFMEIGECEYLVGNYEQSKKYIQEALEHTQTTLEKLKIYRLMTLIFIEVENSELVLDAGFKAMELCNMNISREPKKLHLVQEFLLLKFALQNKSNEQLLNLKPIENEEIDVLIQIMINIVSNSFRMSSNLTGMILLRLMRLQLKYGAPTESAIVFINYALILISGFDNVKEALRFGKLALSMAEAQDNSYIKSRVYFIFGIFLNHWEKDFELSIHYMRTTQLNQEQLGMYYTVTATSCFLCSVQLIDGYSIQEIIEEITYQQSQYGKYPSVLAIDFLTEMKSWMGALQSPTQLPDWDAHITLHDEEAVTVMHYTLRLRMAYLFKNETQLKQLLNDLEKQSSEVYSLPTTPVYYFLRGLCHIDFLKGNMASPFSKKKLVSEFKDSMRRFKKWANEAPHHYEHLYLTLLAEFHFLNKDYAQASLFYDQALQLTKVYHFPQDEAMIYERAGKLFIKLNQSAKARYYISQSINKLREWGAFTIANHWGNEYSHFIIQQTQAIQPTLSYDMISLLETTHALANEMSIEELLQKLLISILKQANATSCYFIRYAENNFSTYAKVAAEHDDFNFTLLPEQIDVALKGIVDYSLLLKEPLVEGNLSNSKYFSNLSVQAKSFLCMPIQFKGEIQAFLYLENNLLENAFNAVQLELLRIIATQLAVTLENAEIYYDLENRVKERTVALDEMNVFLKEANDRLAMNEQERKKLLQSISHELRSPLTSTLGYIDSILDGVVQNPAQQTQYLQRSRERLIALNRLIQDLFELAKLEAGRTDFKYTKISTQQFFEEFAHRFEEDVLQAQLAYSVSCNLQPDLYVQIDLLRIEQVLSNLISNAVKHTSEGRISISMSIEEDTLFCVVEDSGSGILSSELPFIFDSYYRASNSNKLNSHGIGLAICKEIITQHGGKIFADSIPNHGSRFYFTLPISTADNTYK